MPFYDTYILPHVLNCACGTKSIVKQRQKIVPLATGRILEIGMGSGLNLPFYKSDNVDKLWGLEPSEAMRKKAQTNLDAAPFDVEWLGLPGEEIPLDNNSADTIVLTYTLCTIPDWHKALLQMRRVLKPGGKLLFSEHGEAPDANIKHWQEKINPYWKCIVGGCNLHRPIPAMLEQGGFKIDKLESMYLPSTPKIAGFNYWGAAS